MSTTSGASPSLARRELRRSRRHRRSEPRDVVVRRVNLEHEAGVGSDRGGVVAQMGAVGRADLADPRAGRLHQLGEPEAVADLDQLAAAHHDLLAGSQRHGGQQQGGGVVVDDMHVARGRYHVRQGGQRATAAAGAAPGFQVELDVGGAAGRHHRVDGGLRQRRAAEIRVHDDPGGVDHGPQARRADRQGGDGGVDDLLRRRSRRRVHAPELARQRISPLRGRAPAQPRRAAGRRAGRRCGARDVGVVMSDPQRTCGARKRKYGGGGRESNPPATGPAAQRF